MVQRLGGEARVRAVWPQQIQGRLRARELRRLPPCFHNVRHEQLRDRAVPVRPRLQRAGRRAVRALSGVHVQELGRGWRVQHLLEFQGQQRTRHSGRGGLTRVHVSGRALGGRAALHDLPRQQRRDGRVPVERRDGRVPVERRDGRVPVERESAGRQVSLQRRVRLRRGLLDAELLREQRVSERRHSSVPGVSCRDVPTHSASRRVRQLSGVRRRQVLRGHRRDGRGDVRAVRRRHVLRGDGRDGGVPAVRRGQVLQRRRVGVPVSRWPRRCGRERRVRPVRGGHLLPEVRDQRLICWRQSASRSGGRARNLPSVAALHRSNVYVE